MDSIQVAAYTYDVNALLTKVTDPRSGLSTEYSYNAENHLTSVKPAGQVPYQFNYVTVDQREKLDSVTRARPAGDPAGGTAVAVRAATCCPSGVWVHKIVPDQASLADRDGPQDQAGLRGTHLRALEPIVRERAIQRPDVAVLVELTSPPRG